ncbi:MAG TPA: hypothetical protein VGP73_09080 [Thermoanaerobaculia bacterium]
MRKILTTLVLATLSTSVSWAAGPVDFNADFLNTGSVTAYDIALVLAGNETIDGTYNGGTSGYPHFHNFCQSTDGSTTTLHWQTPWDDATNSPVPITPGTTVHVGYSTPDNTSEVIDAFWTDQSGGRIPGGGIAITRGHIDQSGVTVSNSLKSRISISNLRYNVYAQAWPLAGLVGANEALIGSLLPLPGPGAVTLDPGQSVRLDFPSAVPPGYSAVVVFNEGGAEGAANALVFTQAAP